MKQVKSKFENPEAVHSASGFTLIELVTAIAILGVLVTLVMPVIEPIRARAERLICMGNLRSLHVSMSAYLADHKSWPQCPPNASDLGYDNFWLAALEPYGAVETAWLCPSIARQTAHKHRSKAEQEQISRLHYLPTDFDEKPMTPHLYPTHPWFMEIGSPHGRGNIIIRADGSMRELVDLIAEVEAEVSNNLNNP